MIKKEDLKGIRPILQTKKNPTVKDPVRFPKVIDEYENKSKRDFANSLSLEQQQLFSKMLDFVK